MSFDPDYIVWGIDPAHADLDNRAEAFLTRWPDAEYGPAHIVLSDQNYETAHIVWCLDNWGRFTRDHSEDELAATWAFLVDELRRRAPDLEAADFLSSNRK